MDADFVSPYQRLQFISMNLSEMLKAVMIKYHNLL